MDGNSRRDETTTNRGKELITVGSRGRGARELCRWKKRKATIVSLI